MVVKVPDAPIARGTVVCRPSEANAEATSHERTAADSEALQLPVTRPGSPDEAPNAVGWTALVGRRNVVWQRRTVREVLGNLWRQWLGGLRRAPDDAWIAA